VLAESLALAAPACVSPGNQGHALLASKAGGTLQQTPSATQLPLISAFHAATVP
jgi:hypothetical protein